MNKAERFFNNITGARLGFTAGLEYASAFVEASNNGDWQIGSTAEQWGEIELNQDWENEATSLVFDDDSELVFCGITNEYTVRRQGDN